MALMVVPPGMPAPLMVMPGLRPATLVTVTVGELAVVAPPASETTAPAAFAVPAVTATSEFTLMVKVFAV